MTFFQHFDTFSPLNLKLIIFLLLIRTTQNKTVGILLQEKKNAHWKLILVMHGKGSARYSCFWRRGTKRQHERKLKNTRSGRFLRLSKLSVSLSLSLSLSLLLLLLLLLSSWCHCAPMISYITFNRSIARAYFCLEIKRAIWK